MFALNLGRGKKKKNTLCDRLSKLLKNIAPASIMSDGVKSVRRFPVNLNFLITDFQFSVDWRPFTDIQYVMNMPAKCIRCRRSTPFARVYT